MDDVDFTDDEICKELEELGYKNIPPERFQQFKYELFHLIRQERSINSSSNSSRTDLSYNAPVSRSQSSVANKSASLAAATDKRPAQLVVPDKENFTRTRDMGRIADGSSVGDMSEDVIPSTKTSYAQPSRKQPTHAMKRKVLRKVDGQVSICESCTESEASDDLAALQEQLRNTVLETRRPQSAPPAGVVHSSAVRSSSDQFRPHTACREPSHYNLPEDYQGPKALIRPMSCEPNVQNIKKTDPVLRYQVYQRCWNACRAPGEKAHKQLRWGVREKMLYHDQVVEKKAQRPYQPNGYVIPSDKKRKTLRWQIRMDLAQGVKPPSVFD